MGRNIGAGFRAGLHKTKNSAPDSVKLRNMAYDEFFLFGVFAKTAAENPFKKIQHGK
ncbi:MAG: hypothetical protein Tsb0015_04260 [Simkaniaceae bacterium]